MSGCASLQYAGSASYSVRPFIENGKTICCRVDVHNGKEIGAVVVNVQKDGDNYKVFLQETGVQAFKGQQIAGSALQDSINGAVKAAIVTVLAPVLPSIAGAITVPSIAAVGGGAAAVVVGKKIVNKATVVNPTVTKGK